MKTFLIYHYRYHRDLWEHTPVQAPDAKAARKAFHQISSDHIISVQEMRS